jgi:hypothetical protein
MRRSASFFFLFCPFVCVFALSLDSSFSVVFFDDSMKIFVFSFSLCVFVYVYVVCVFVEIRASLVVFAVCCFRRSRVVVVRGIGFGGYSKSKRRLSPMFARRFGRNERKPRRIKRKRRRKKEIDDRENEHCSSYYSRDLLLLLLNRCRFKMMVRCASELVCSLFAACVCLRNETRFYIISQTPIFRLFI